MTRRQALLLPAVPVLLKASGMDLRAFEKPRVLRAAARYLNQPPVTVTASQSPRSAGGLHDYFSEGDYWWPDPAHPEGPYIQRDGMSNPGNFDDHRKALLRLSVQAPALSAAWLLTRDRKYAEAAARHLRAWFLTPATRMNPNLLYAQAIHGRATGRGTGIIDTIHLVEVTRGASAIADSGALTATETAALHQWFADYLEWISTHPYGIAERDAKNNHGTCWVMQAAEFARFTGNSAVTEFCRERFRTALLNQIAPDGSFPLELKRTKPYGYSLFNLETLSAAAQILNQWNQDARLRTAAAYMFPFIADKSKWPFPPDVMYFDRWPVRQHSLLFSGLAYNQPEYLALWRKLDPDPTVEEVIRNYPVRQPTLWLQAAKV